MFNKQEAFNTIIDHLRNQGGRSVNGETCLYRGPRGLKCAAGALIPDNVYTKDMEGHSASFVFQEFLNINDFESLDFIRECQLKLHDCLSNKYFKEQLEEAIKEMKIKHNLV